MSNQLFIDEYYSDLYNEIKREVHSREDSYLLSVNIEEYSEFLFNKYSFATIEYDESRQISIEKIRKFRGILDYETNIESIFVKIHIPVAPNDEISTILELRTSTYTLSPLKMSYINGEIITEGEAKEAEIERAINEVKQEVEWRNKDIHRCNELLKTQIKGILTERKKKIKNEEELLDQITKKIPVVLHKRDKAASTIFPTVKVKEKIRSVIPPIPSQPEEMHLKEAEFKAILQLINNTCLGFERTPATFSKMEEEDLRDIILSSLNGVFEGDAHGEAFSKLGKTDIYLKVSKGGVFIAECKFWEGPRTVEQALSQILDYLTWRQSYGVVILFSRNRGFSDVVDTIKEIIPSLPMYVKGFNQVGDTHFQGIHHLKEDEKKLLEIHYLAYNLYCEKSRQRITAKKAF